MPTNRSKQDRRRHDAKRYAEQPWRAWYSLKAWQDRRTRQLALHPLCEMCKAQGHITAATVADHVTPHRGNRELFFNGKLQSLCDLHHAATKQRQESTGIAEGSDSQGHPIDPRHHWNAS